MARTLVPPPPSRFSPGSPPVCPVSPPSASPPLLVACLCAQWCGTCRDYRPVFDGALTTLGDAAHGRWIDIEDDEALLGPVDVLDFPTLLIARGPTPVFFGPLTPQPGTLARLLHGAVADTLGRLDDPEITGLVARVWSAAGD